MQNELSPEKIRRIKQAIAECDVFISKESIRNPKLRPKDIQQHLDFCINHREKLKAMLPK